MNKEIDRIRQNIDDLDSIIVDALVKRINCVFEIVKYKKTGTEARSLNRVQEVLDKIKDQASQAGGHEDLICEIYKSIIKILTDVQLNIVDHPSQ